jgi:hypothetical protein
MEKTPKSDERMPLSLADVGMLRGLWSVATDGYVWDDDVELLVPDEADIASPGAGPWLRPANMNRQAMSRVYPVLKDRKLFRDFVEVGRHPSRDETRRFADRWGMLERGHLVRVKNDPSSPAFLSEPLSKWVRESRQLAALWDTWMAARTLRLADAHGSTTVRDARAVLASRIVWNMHGGGSVHHQVLDEDGGLQSFQLIASASTSPDVFRSFQEGDVIGPARFFARQRVNEQLRGRVHLTVVHSLKPDDDERVRFVTSDLLGAIYVHFAMEIADVHGPERECESCHQPFLMNRDDQRFCDKNCRERAGYHRRKKKRESWQSGQTEKGRSTGVRTDAGVRRSRSKGRGSTSSRETAKKSRGS